MDLSTIKLLGYAQKAHQEKLLTEADKTRQISQIQA